MARPGWMVLVVLAASGSSLPAARAQPADRLQQYLGLAKATRERPITPRALATALRSPAAVAAIAALFEKSLASGLATVTPELGGEATLDGGRLRFLEYPDPLHAVVRRMIELEDDAGALLEFLQQSPEGREVLETTGGLHAHLHQMTTTPGATAVQRVVLRQILASAVAVHFKTWSLTPERQLEMIQQHDWRGRYVGFWHIHPPLQTAEGYAAGLEPSMADMKVAVEEGQMLTIVFRPDGFDAYDLSPLGEAGTADLTKAHVVRYRSPAWARRFRSTLQVGGSRHGSS